VNAGGCNIGYRDVVANNGEVSLFSWKTKKMEHSFIFTLFLHHVIIKTEKLTNIS
jgi:hypothetical protein